MFKATSLLLLLILFVSSTAAQPGRDMEREKAIWAELEALSPASVADFKAATEAMEAGDYEKAAELYQAVQQKAPDFDPALRRLGGCLVVIGKTEAGYAFMERAVAIRRSPENLISLAQSLAYPGPGKDGTKQQKARAYVLIQEVNRSPQQPNDPDYLSLQEKRRPGTELELR